MKRSRFTEEQIARIRPAIDNRTRECLALVADTSLSGAGVARQLDAIIARRGRRPDASQRQRYEIRLQRPSWPGPAVAAWAGNTSRRASPKQEGFNEARQGSHECLGERLRTRYVGDEYLCM